MAKRGIIQHKIRLVAGMSSCAAAHVSVCVAVLLWVPAVVHAQSKNPTFLGKTLSAAAATYFVLKDANVRGGPLTKSPRVGRMQKGIRIRAAGKAKGTNWVAVRKKGEDWGFIYGTTLAPAGWCYF